MITVKPLPPSVLAQFSVDGIPDRRHVTAGNPREKLGIAAARYSNSFCARLAFRTLRQPFYGTFLARDTEILKLALESFSDLVNRCENLFKRSLMMSERMLSFMNQWIIDTNMIEIAQQNIELLYNICM